MNTYKLKLTKKYSTNPIFNVYGLNLYHKSSMLWILRIFPTSYEYHIQYIIFITPGYLDQSYSIVSEEIESTTDGWYQMYLLKLKNGPIIDDSWIFLQEI